MKYYVIVNDNESIPFIVDFSNKDIMQSFVNELIGQDFKQAGCIYMSPPGKLTDKTYAVICGERIQ